MFKDKITAIKQKIFNKFLTLFYIVLSLILIIFILWVSTVDTDDITSYVNTVSPLTVEDMYHDMIHD